LQSLVQNLHTKSSTYKQQALIAKQNNNLSLARSRLQLYKATESHANKAEQSLCNLQDAQDRIQQATWNHVVVEVISSFIMDCFFLCFIVSSFTVIYFVIVHPYPSFTPTLLLSHPLRFYRC